MNMDSLPDGTTMIKSKGVTALVRNGTSDRFIVQEVISGNTYRRLNVTEGDTVLDIGMNIGMFSISALLKGATVYAFEPDPTNFGLAVLNVQLNGFRTGFYPYESAVVGTNDQRREFSINLKRNKGAHSLVHKRGRTLITVNSENINSILDRIHPTVIKMDIEGGEYECLRAVKSFDGVREMILEFHHARLLDVKSRLKYREIIQLLQKHFSDVHFRSETKKAWVTLVYCRNC